MRYLVGAFLAISSAAWAGSTDTLVLELFTSKYCPNCPAIEHHFAVETPKNLRWLLLQQHVDYWDKGDRKDPYGMADATQRQYDYSNTIGRRAGEVYTPMPLLNGQFASPPPLFLNWDKAVTQADAATAPALLTLTTTEAGGVSVNLPKGATEAVLMGAEEMGAPNALRVRAIQPMDISGNTAKLSKALLPATPVWVVLAQERGPGAVLGFAKVPGNGVAR